MLVDDRILVVDERPGVRHQFQASLLLVSDAQPLADNNTSIVEEQKMWALEDLSIMVADRTMEASISGDTLQMCCRHVVLHRHHY